MNDKKIELLKKLKELSERGVGGEKENATKMLTRLQRKYDVSDIEIETTEEKYREFTVPRFKLYNRLFWQIIGTYGISKYKKTRKRDVILINCTASLQLEILAKFQFFYTYFQKDIETFFLAFISKNELWSKTSKEPTEVTAEELLEHLKARQLAQKLQKYEYDTDKLKNEQLQLDI
ncbi:hypothetical protein BN85407480 [Alteracholeplasma palmae J233]|uniref:DUF2786 domain-containing protein n=1 Tax=Alteracholeplasma palmae (strain ATCC 49389 / J233) TaxID=1318466 RepID=U4KPV4_ALTPJ|nr:hypothetical protein [Alteracholeplasma palmae]CCV64325.1 hypothetical protein BN85407480 [Alteracholeplasma palmae J233]